MEDFSFHFGNELCIGIAITGLVANTIVYLITEFNINNIEATDILNISNGGNDLSPLIGAFVADAYLGRFRTLSICFVIALIGMILLLLTAIIDPLRPPPCSPNQRAAGNCVGSTRGQYGFLYVYFALLIAGSAGARFNSRAAFGADQFAKGGGKQVQRFFNWYFCVVYVSIMIGSTVIVYIQTNVSWAWGFGICVALTGVALILFFSGTRLYNCVRPEGSPFTGLLQVIVASFKKSHLKLPSNAEDLYYGVKTESGLLLTQQLRFLNKAAIKTSSDISPDGHRNLNPWRLCTVQQVEELKSIIKTLPIWSCAVVPEIINTQLNTFSVLQALTMDRHLGPHFKVPAASFFVFGLLAGAIALSIYDKVVVPWATARAIKITKLRRIAVGMLMTIAAMGVATLVERKRLRAVKPQVGNISFTTVSLSAFWLLPQFIILMVGEALRSVGRVDFFYFEFPETVRSTATALVGTCVALGFYTSSLLIAIIHKNTDWLNNNLNQSRLDYFYALLCVLGVLNFAYFMPCARWYKYKAKVDNSHNISMG